MPKVGFSGHLGKVFQIRDPRDSGAKNRFFGAFGEISPRALSCFGTDISIICFEKMGVSGGQSIDGPDRGPV